MLAYTGTLTAAGTGVGAAGTKTSTYQVNYAGTAGGQLAIGGTITNSGLTVATTVSALSGTSIANTNVLTVAASNATITSVDAALQQIDSTRALNWAPIRRAFPGGGQRFADCLNQPQQRPQRLD